MLFLGEPVVRRLNRHLFRGEAALECGDSSPLSERRRGRTHSRALRAIPSYILFPILGSFLLHISSAEPLKLVDSMDRLVLLNSNHWKTGEVEGRTSLILDKTGEQRPPVRRPGEYALLQRDRPIGEFTLEAITLEPESIKNRDICLIFGYQDDTHFYYAHISSNSDNRFHNIIMRVDGDSRTRINLETDPEPRLSKDWKNIRIQHLENGEIRVFVDDLTAPLMTASDQTYPIGQIGFGAFDDRAAFATLTVE